MDETKIEVGRRGQRASGGGINRWMPQTCWQLLINRQLGSYEATGQLAKNPDYAH